jgi:hypothetical protein
MLSFRSLLSACFSQPHGLDGIKKAVTDTMLWTFKQCCGSVTYWYGSGSKYFCVLLYEGTFTSFFRDKKVIKGDKTGEIP